MNRVRDELQHTSADLKSPNQELIKETITLKNMKAKFVVADLVKKWKFMTPPTYINTNIKEQWEQNTQEKQTDKQQKNIQSLNYELSNFIPICAGLQIAEGIFIIAVIWIITTEIIFNLKLFFPVYIFMFFMTFGKLLIKTIYIVKIQQYYYWFKHLYIQLFQLVTSILMIVRYLIQVNEFQYPLIAWVILFIILQIKNAGELFQFIVFYAQKYQMRKQLQIIQVFTLMIFVAHFFGLILYAMSYISSYEKNWIDQAGLTGENWPVLYLYSIYWAITTMVTVGFGDLTPNNPAQVAIITFIQLIGTALFGYMINVIGITVDQIQKQNQQFQKMQGTIDKLKNYYQLSKQLCTKMKQDLKKKETFKKMMPLRPSEEEQFLQSIQHSLKQQFVLETNMRVIKKSIFFLTHFTTNFQNQVALKLQRFIYKIDEEVKISDKNDFYLNIINAGKVNIVTQRVHNTSEFTKHVKTIQSIEGKPNLNVFGYSSLIMNKKVNLRGFVEQISVVYAISRKQLLEVMDKNMLDFQSFSELKQKMIQYRFLEQVQAPAIRDIEKHYILNIYFLQKKTVCILQQRKKYNRSNRKMKNKITTLKDYRNKTIVMLGSDSQIEFKIKTENHISIEDFEQFDSLKKLESKHLREQKIHIDQHKDFDNFMKNFNLSKISGFYQRSCIKHSYRRKLSTAFRLKRPTCYDHMYI